MHGSISIESLMVIYNVETLNISSAMFRFPGKPREPPKILNELHHTCLALTFFPQLGLSPSLCLGSSFNPQRVHSLKLKLTPLKIERNPKIQVLCKFQVAVKLRGHTNLFFFQKGDRPAETKKHQKKTSNRRGAIRSMEEFSRYKSSWCVAKRC